MDPSDPTPKPEPLPGAPAGPSNGGPAAAPAPRDPKGRFQKGQSGNPKGRAPGIPNLNDELVRAVKRYRLGEKNWLQAILTRALQDPDLAKVVLDKVLVNATPAGPAISIRNSNEQTHQESHVQIGEHLGDPAVRNLVAELTQRLGDRGAFAGANGHARE
jgi:hypothetical protein